MATQAFQNVCGSKTLSEQNYNGVPRCSAAWDAALVSRIAFDLRAKTKKFLRL